MPANRFFLRLGSGQRPEKVEELKIKKNLNEIDVQEMDTKEMKDKDGGIVYTLFWLMGRATKYIHENSQTSNAYHNAMMQRGI